MRTVAHWDGDRFFASIEQASDRRLRNRPVAVGGDRRGVILSASAEARRLGVRPGWPTARARRAIPSLIVVPAHFELYERFFDEILSLCRETTPLVEPAQVGAAWLDLTGSESFLHQPPAKVVSQFRATVTDWLHISLSAGIATNKTVARLAACLRKPASQLVVPPGAERSFLAPLSLRWLPGLDPAVLDSLEVAGFRTIGQFACAPLDALATVLGRQALPLLRRAQGISEEPVGRKRAVAPGFSEFVEFPNDVWEEPFLLLALRRMLERLMAQVRAASTEVRRLTLELRYTDRDESRHSVDLPEPTCLESESLHLLPRLLENAWTRRVRLRALTLKATRLYNPSPQLSLFEPASPRRSQDLRLAAAIDRLRLTHGPSIIRRAGDLTCNSFALP